MSHELPALTAEWSLLCAQLKVQNSVLHRAPPEFSAAMRHKAAILRLRELSLSIQQAARICTEPSTWASYLVSNELLEAQPRHEDYYSPVQTTIPVMRPTQPAPLPTAPLPAG